MYYSRYSQIALKIIQMKRNKRLKELKQSSAAAKVKWGTSPKAARKIKNQQRKKLRLANKEINEEDE